ncbi:MAG: S8 family serine peptidase [Actinomycetota bacterium]
MTRPWTESSLRTPLHLSIAALALGIVVLGGPAAADDTPVVGADEPPTAVIIETVDLGVPGDAPTLAGLLEAQVDGMETTGALDDVDVVAAEVSAEAFEELREAGVVESIRPARQDLRLLLDESVGTIGAGNLQLDGFTGEGRVVAVIDSGVDADHPGLDGSVVDQACFLDGLPTFSTTPSISVTELCKNGTRTDTSAEPCVTLPATCSHGTAVAGVISGDDETLTGVAPDAGIMALRVTGIVEGIAEPGDPEFPYSAYIPEAGVLAALEHVYDMRAAYSISAVNLSLGGSPGTCQDALWEDVVDRLTDAGIAVVAASGNNGWDDAMTFPACLDRVISVGASTDTADVASFSNTSDDLDLLAPGSPIESTVLFSYDGSGYTHQQGTSFAAPHVAAAFALLEGQWPSGWDVSRRLNLLRSAGSMVTRTTLNPFDRDPRFPELRLEEIIGFDPFDDAGGGFWVQPSDWAKFVGVSTGIGGNDFSPDGQLTRAQAVTFLWRFMGSPDFGTSSGFSDVDPGAWYAQAVAWAAAAGVTTGVEPGIFAPDDVVTRGQLATFMWRTAGEPSPSFSSGFLDVASTAFYALAVDWMAEHGITTGTAPGLFSPEDVVSRAQMVTFEFRLADADNAWSGSVAPPDLALF